MYIFRSPYGGRPVKNWLPGGLAQARGIIILFKLVISLRARSSLR